MLENISPEEILTWDINKLWNTVNQIKHQKGNINPEEYEKIKNGIRLKCHIKWITEEWYELYPSTKKARIEGYGKYKLTDFTDEIDERENMMRQIILDNIEEGITKPRIN